MRTWNSRYIKSSKIYEEVDFQDLLSIKNKKNMHNYKMLGGLLIIFIVGGMQALQGVGGYSSYIEAILPILIALEHSFNGRTGSN